MIDFDQLLKNDTVKDLLKKCGVSDDKVDSVVAQAAGSLKKKQDKDPSQMKSLLSANPNTEKDEILKKEVEDDFLEGLIKKAGLPAGIAEKASGVLPTIMKQFSGASNKNGSSNESGMMDTITNLIGGDDKKGGILSFITNFFKKK